MSRLVLVLLGALTACGGAQRERVAFDEERLAHARSLAVERRAPELFARAERARAEAGAAPPDSPARQDATSEARLWLEAAIAEATRVQLSEERLAAERELDAAEQDIVALERERAELARENELRAAAAIAAEEARRALERASLTPKLRPALSRAEVTAAAEALLARAVLVASALEALGQHDGALEAQFGEVRSLLGRDPELALDRADALLSTALAALGPLRRAAGAPTAEETASLGEALRGTGARVTRGDRGLTAVVDKAYGARALSPAARAELARLCTVATSHPHGSVRAVVGGAATRAKDAAAELARAGCQGARFGVDSSPLAGDDLALTWLAY